MPVANTLPITISEGDFGTFETNGVETTPLAKIAVRFSEAVINTTWTKAETLSTENAAKIAAVGTAIDGIIATPGDYHVAAGSVAVPVVTAPNVTLPATIDTSTILATFDTEYPLVATFLKERGEHIMSTYFPNNTASYAAAESWLQAAIANPEAGLPAAVVAQIWGDDQARILSDASRASDAVVAQFATRRFPLPPAVAASAVLQIQQKAQDQLSESSRKVAILSVELQKFNVEKLISLRGMAISAMVNYIGAMATAPTVAASITGIGYGEQSKLISAAAGFYKADTDAKEMMNKVAQFNTSMQLQADEKNQSVNVTLMEAKLRALLADVQSTMQQATAMYNNLHASAGTSVSI